jgi:hypothetical protein
MLRVYLTYCAREKEDSYKETKEKMFPDQLYKSTRIQEFMNQCKDRGIRWAILSDKHGVWFSNVKHKWYDKPPDCVTPDEFSELLRKVNEKLSGYSEILFYCDPSSLHPLYDRLLKETELADRVKIIRDLSEIV